MNIHGVDQTIFATQLWLEIVSDCCDCHEAPPERLDKCPGVAGVGGVDGGQASAVQPPNLSSLLLCKVHEAVATLSNIAGPHTTAVHFVQIEIMSLPILHHKDQYFNTIILQYFNILLITAWSM